MTMWRFRRPSITVRVAILLPLLLAACGPSVPPDVGVNSVALDLVLGKPPTQLVTAAPSVPSTPLTLPTVGLPGFPSIVIVPGDLGFNGFKLPPAPEIATCAAADPAKGSVESTTEVDNAPTDGSYQFRDTSDSTYSSNGSKPARFINPFQLHVTAGGPYAGTGNPSNAPGEYTFAQSAELLVMTVNSVFQSQSSSSNPAGPLAGEQTSQLGLASMSILLPGEGTLTFNAPAGHALDILKTPANSSLQGTVTNGGQTSGSPPTWQDAVSDPADGSSMSINGAVTSTKPVQVDACGQNIDTWPVTATITFTSGPPSGGALGATPGTTNLSWTVNYNVATGMGGLIVHEDGGTSCTGQPCTLDGKPYVSTFNFTINDATPLAP